MKGRVKDGDLGQIGENFDHGLDTRQVGRIMEGGQRNNLFNALHDIDVDLDRRGEPISAVNDPVPGSGEFIETPDDAMSLMEKVFKDKLDGLFVVGDRHVGDDRIHASLLMLDSGTVDADPFHQPLGEDRFVGHVEELVLERRAAAVENENFHTCVDLP